MLRIKSETQIAQHLSNQARKKASKEAKNIYSELNVVPGHLTSFSIFELINHAIVVAPNYKGISNLVYGSFGKLVVTGAGLNLGAAFCPGIMDITIVPGVSAEKLNEVLFIVHRSMAEYYLKNGLKQFRLDNMVSFAAMAGKSWEVSFNLKTKIQPSTSTLSDIVKLDSLGLPKIKITATTKIKGKKYDLTDPYPAWYKTAKGDDIRTDLLIYIGGGDKREIKRRIIDYLKYLKKEYIPDLPQNPLYNNIKENFKDSLPHYDTFPRNSSTVDTRQRLQNIWNAFKNTNYEDSPREPDLKRIEDNLENLYEEIIRAETKPTLNLDQENLKVGESYKEDSMPALTERKSLCKVNMVTFKIEGEIVLKQGMKVGMTKPESPDSEEDLPVTITGPGIKQEIKLDAKYVKTYYRYQTYAFGRNINKNSYSTDKTFLGIMYTQDTQIKYSKIALKHELKAALEFRIGKKKIFDGIKIIGEKVDGILNKINFNKSFVNNMSYKAVTAYWDYTSDGTDKNMLSGSGLSFGCSISMQTLLRIALDIHSYEKSNKYNRKSDQAVFLNAEIKNYSKLLRIKESEFEEFAKSLLSIENLKADKKYNALKKYGAVLIESSFQFTDYFNMRIDKETRELEDLINDDHEWSQFYHGRTNSFGKAKLESIRIRVRINDHMNQSKKSFRLGLNLWAVKGNVEVKKIEKAGNEGIKTVHSHWFLDEFKNLTNDEKFSKGVPTVVLLPHRFEL